MGGPGRLCALTVALGVALCGCVFVGETQAEECSPGVKILQSPQSVSPAEQDRLLRTYKSQELRSAGADFKQRWDALRKDYLDNYHGNVFLARARDERAKEWLKLQTERSSRHARNYSTYLSQSKQIDAQYKAANQQRDSKKLAALSARSEAAYRAYSDEYARIEKAYHENGKAMEAAVKAKYGAKATFERDRYQKAEQVLRAEYAAAKTKIFAMTYGDVPTSYANLNSSADCSLVAGTPWPGSASASEGGSPVSSSSQCGGLGRPPLDYWSCSDWQRHLESVKQQRIDARAKRIDTVTRSIFDAASNSNLGSGTTVYSLANAIDQYNSGEEALGLSTGVTGLVAFVTDKPTYAAACGAVTLVGGPVTGAAACPIVGGGAVLGKNELVGAATHRVFRLFLDDESWDKIYDFSILSYE